MTTIDDLKCLIDNGYNICANSRVSHPTAAYVYQKPIKLPFKDKQVICFYLTCFIYDFRDLKTQDKSLIDVPDIGYQYEAWMSTQDDVEFNVVYYGSNKNPLFVEDWFLNLWRKLDADFIKKSV